MSFDLSNITFFDTEEIERILENEGLKPGTGDFISAKCRRYRRPVWGPPGLYVETKDCPDEQSLPPPEADRRQAVYR
jgi:hypothetical protein